MRNLQDQIEIEEKFIVRDIAVLNEIESYFINSENEKGLASFVVSVQENKRLRDIYFDTEDFKLLENGEILRYRHIVDGQNANEDLARDNREYILTIKSKIRGDSNANEDQAMRHEFEMKVKSKNPLMHSEYIHGKLINSNAKVEDLRERVIVENNRKIINAKSRNSCFCVEIALDNVKYFKHTNREAFLNEFQMELELKQGKQYRNDLSVMASGLIEKFGDKIIEDYSPKFERAVKKLYFNLDK